MPASSKTSLRDLVQVDRLRAKPPIPQAQLSEATVKHGVSIDRAGISKIEIGDRSVYDFEVKALATVLSVTLDWLLKEG